MRSNFWKMELHRLINILLLWSQAKYCFFKKNKKSRVGKWSQFGSFFAWDNVKLECAKKGFIKSDFSHHVKLKCLLRLSICLTPFFKWMKRIHILKLTYFFFIFSVLKHSVILTKNVGSTETIGWACRRTGFPWSTCFILTCMVGSVVLTICNETEKNFLHEQSSL